MTRREFEVTDRDVIRGILDRSKVLRLGLIDGALPYVKGYKLDVIAKNPVCCFEMDCDVSPFQGKIACQYGITYYSLMGRGQVQLVEDPREKEQAMALLMKTQTGKDFEFNERLVSIVSVLRIDVSEYTAKHRPRPGEM